MPPANPRPQPLQLIRLMLLAGVLIFGAVTVFIHRQPNWTPGSLPIAMTYAMVAYAIAAVGIAGVLKGRVGREPELPRRVSLLLMGWAIGESAAVAGVVIFYITGQGQWYALGLLAMVCSFAMLSPDAASQSAVGLDTSR